MKYKSVILTSAKIDLKEASLHYKNIDNKLGKQFINKFRERLNILKIQPLTCQIRHANVRTAIMETFPYMIHYIVDQHKKTIVVIALLHTSRDPKIWNERTEL